MFDGRIETEGNDGPIDIVVDGFRYANQRNALLVKLLSDGERAVSADDDKSIEFEFAEVRNDCIGDVALRRFSAFTEDGIAEGICGVGCAENRAAKVVAEQIRARVASFFLLRG